jgi:small subunit ribosomal protein S10
MTHDNEHQNQNRLKAYDHKLLDQSATDIVDTANKTGAKVVGPIPLPTQDQQVLCVAFTPHRQEIARAV